MPATRRSVMITAAALLAAATPIVVPAGSAAAASYTMTVVSPVEGGIGIDAIYQNGGGGGIYDVAPCSAGNDPTLGWNRSGQLVGTRSVPDSKPGLGSLTMVRFEMYPGPCGTYDPWTSDVGGVHIQTTPWNSNLGQIQLPVLGQPGAFRIDGDIVSSLPIGPNRVEVDTFQIPTAYPDPPAPLPNNGSVGFGTFASAANSGARWTGGVGWGGHYILFVRDLGTGRSVTALTDIAPGAVPTIDLDAVCFGFDICTQTGGSPPPVSGTFYPTPPTRILDTRLGVGITNGPIRSGDGRHWTLDPVVRRDEARNHELQVTGRFGVPASGVSAVLLNVTAVDAPGPGYLSIVPKPVRVGDVFNDQASFGAYPTTSNLNVDGPEATPNMVLARVGAGGKIRFYNPYGPTHVIADIAGWFGTDGRYNEGAGFEGIVPRRLLDTRIGQGGPATRFAPYETRFLKVAGVGGIPANAESVVVNITSVVPDRPGSYITAFPRGESLPTASNVNGRTNGVRANLAVVKVGDGGQIALHAGVSGTHMIVDVLGSFGPYGGEITAVDPARAVDTRVGIGTAARPIGQGEERSIAMRGRAGVPAGATAVVVNVTATNATGGGYFTAYPSDAARPIVSNLHFEPGQTVPNLAILALGPDGAIKVFNERGTTDLLIDVVGYVG